MTMAKVTRSNFYKILSHKNFADCAVLLVIYWIIYLSSKYTAVFPYQNRLNNENPVNIWDNLVILRAKVWSRCVKQDRNVTAYSTLAVVWYNSSLFSWCYCSDFTSWHISSGHFVDLHQSICPNICSQNNGHCNDHLGTYLQPCSESLVIRYSFASDVSNRDLQVTHPWVTSRLCRQ